jgi:hypothetical protein
MPHNFDNAELAELDALHNIVFYSSPVMNVNGLPIQAFYCRYCSIIMQSGTTVQQMHRHTHGARHKAAKAKADMIEKQIDDIIVASDKRNNEDKDGKGGGKGGGAGASSSRSSIGVMK